MGVQGDVRLEYIDRVELLAGPTGRRNWPDEVKGEASTLRLIKHLFVHLSWPDSSTGAIY